MPWWDVMGGEMGRGLMKQTLIFSDGFLSALLIVAASLLIWEGTRITKVHTLTRPMIISSDEGDKTVYTLPPGTVLYFEKSFPEGFSRYKVYINVDRMPLALRDLPTRTKSIHSTPASSTKVPRTGYCRNDGLLS
jgi:hypothetical protein